MTDFATLVEEYRGKKQITKTELTQRSGLSSGYVSLLTRGARKSPSEETVARIADALMLDAESRMRLFEAAGYSPDSALSARQELSVASHQDWGDAPDLRVFYGRNQELEELEQWITEDRCRVIAVLGTGGIGKTILAARLAEKLQTAFQYVIWRSLQNALPLQDFLRDCIQFLSHQHYEDIPDDTEKQLTLLMDCLQRHCCLIILDNFETILQANSVGQYRGGYEGYSKLLQRLGEGRHQSCLLLTSREKPKEIAILEGNTFPVRSYILWGLQLVDGKEFLKDKGLHGTEENWQVLIDYYWGNPLALMVVSQFIREVFEGDIASFLAGGNIIFSDIRDVLDEQFDRLASLEREIMYWLAIEREPVSPDDLMNNIVHPLTRKELLEAFSSLRRRHMIEVRVKAFFTLQPVIMEYMIDKFVDGIFAEINHEEDFKGKYVYLDNYPLIKALAKDYIRNIEVELIVKPVVHRLRDYLEQAESERKLKKILSDLQKPQSSAPGYAAGNILNLLIHLNIDPRGYDFSHLTVWQAYLRGILLRDIDFTSSDLSKSVFTDTFSSIFSVALNMTGELLAAGTANGEIRTWTTAEAYPHRILRGHTEWVRSVSFSPLNDILVSGSEDQTIRVWDVDTEKCLKVLEGHASTVYSVVFSPDGRTIASGSGDQTIRLWDVQTGTCLNTLRGHGSRIFSVAFSPDGRTIASGSGDQTIRLWDVQSGTCLKTLHGHTNWIWSVSFSPTRNVLASGSDDKTVRIWDIETGECLKILEGGRVYSLAFSPDGNMIVCGSDGQAVRLLDVNAGSSLKTLQGHGSRIYSVALHPNEDTIASGGEDGVVRLWYAFNSEGVRELPGHTHWIWSVCFSPNGVILASGSEDRTVRIWNTSTGACLRVLNGHANRVYCVTFSPDGNLLASSSGDQTVKVWDVDSGECLKTFEDHSSRVYCVTFSPDGNLLASSSGDQTVKVWDVDSGECLNVLKGHSGHVRSVSFSPDGNTLASGGDDRVVMIWNVRTGKLIKELKGHRSWVFSVAFKPDGTTIASSSEDRTVRLWDVGTGNSIGVLRGEGETVYSVAFNRSGNTIVTGSHEGIIEIWDVHTQEHLETPLRSARPYEGMNITRVKGLSESQKAILKALGAFEH